MRGRGLPLFFGLTLLLPGAALAVFGARALIHERQLANQQIRERVETAADIISGHIGRQIEEWQIALDRPAGAGIPEALQEPGVATIVSKSREGLSVFPRTSLLHDLPSSPPQPLLERRKSPALLEAELLELQRRDYPGALLLYRALLASARVDERAEVIHHLARTYRKAGRPRDALPLFEQLRTASGFVGSVPASLIGQYEVCAHWASTEDRLALSQCALDLYSKLVAGAWTLSKERYSYYSVTARNWAEAGAAPASQVATLLAQETAKAKLGEAAERLASGMCGAETARSPAVHAIDDVLAVVRCQDTGARRRGHMLVVSRSWLATHVWPAAGNSAGAGYHMALSDRDNRTLYDSHPEPAAVDKALHVVTRDALGGQGWRLRVWPRDAGALAAGFVASQRLYVLTLTLVIASLAFGAYTTHRVIRRELQVARLKSDFVSTVSHEFRSPLTAIRQLGEMLMRDRVPDSRRREYYERITSESERLGRLVENLLDFAQMEEGRKRYRLQPVETAEWLRRTVTEFQALRESSSAAIAASIPASLPALRGDAAALSCAIHNLLDNALKYSPGTDTVWIEAEESGPGITVRVRDRGVGISDSDRPRIFDRFFRADGEITRQVKGAGLGLSLVQHIVAAHNGSIECHSQPGQGSTFSIHLPAEMASS